MNKIRNGVTMVRVRVGYRMDSGEAVIPPRYYPKDIDFKSFTSHTEVNDGIVRQMINKVLEDSRGERLPEDMVVWWALRE